tara:strand:- start:165 stop:752 length:588 start_codon:yes stop_codon:yes gene_type:complete
MCEPTIIASMAFAINSAQQVAEYKAAKEQARAQELRNKEAAKSANRSYLADLSELDRIEFQKNRDALSEKEGKEKELIKKQSAAQLKALESGNENVEAQLRDIGFDYESEFDRISQTVFDNNINTIFGYDDAYSAMRRSYTKIPDVVRPSALGLGIGIAGAGVQSYGNLEAGKYGKSKPSDISDPFKGRTPGGSL